MSTKFQLDTGAVSAVVNREVGIKPGNENDPVSNSQAGRIARILAAGLGYEYPDNAYESGVAMLTQALGKGDIDADQHDLLGNVDSAQQAMVTLIYVARGKGADYVVPKTKQAASAFIVELEKLAV